MNIKSFKYLTQSRKGATAVIFALALTMILMMSALTIDVGASAMHKAKLIAALDSSALAGAQEYITNSDNVNNIVEQYLVNNSMDITSPEITIDETVRTIQISGSIQRDFYFARIFGFNNGIISGTSKARIDNISSLEGARPIAVVHQDFVYGDLYTLKEGGGDGTTGNYAAIALGGGGAAIYKDNLLNGYTGKISVGDKIQTETGNIAGATETSIHHLIDSCSHYPLCTYSSYNRHCSRIMFIPVVNTLTVNGKKYVEVLGFATFFLEGVVNKAGQAEVIGRFITYNMEGTTSSDINDYGTYGIKLVR